ncbi:MAG: hypothetical protein ACKVPY_07280 [Paracoccaceae bacterium]
MTPQLAFIAGLLSAGPLAVGLLWLAARIGDLLPDDPDDAQPAITPFLRMKHP